MGCVEADEAGGGWLKDKRPWLRRVLALLLLFAGATTPSALCGWVVEEGPRLAAAAGPSDLRHATNPSGDGVARPVLSEFELRRPNAAPSSRVSEDGGVRKLYVASVPVEENRGVEGHRAGDSAEMVSRKNEVEPAGSRDTVHIASVVMSTTSPHALVNKKYDIFSERLSKMGKKVEYTYTRSLDNLFPLLDRKEGAPDFVYLPHEAFATYRTKTSKYGGGDGYVVVAGSLDFSDIDLVVRSTVESLRDLAGKTIAISNNRYVDEFHLNKLLATVGLSTKAMGGNVEIVWDGTVSATLGNYAKGLYDGVVVFNTDNRDAALARVPGSKVQKLNPEGLYGGQHPRVWMAARKELIKSDPALVREVLKAHVLLNDKALEHSGELAALNRDMFIGYFKEKGADISSAQPLEQFIERWKFARITYDPNMEFITEMFCFLELKGLLRSMKIGDFVQISPLNEVLRDMGRPEVPN